MFGSSHYKLNLNAMNIRLGNKNLFVTLLLVCLVSLVVLFNSINRQERNPQTKKEMTKLSPWIEYRNNWIERVLINVNTSTKEIQFTDEYRSKMREKGFHPLSIIHPRLLERAMKMEEYCKVFQPLNNGVHKMEWTWNVLFNDKFELLQCMVPKASSSTWADIFIEMSGMTYDGPRFFEPSHPVWNNISLVNYLDRKITAKRYQTYTKFMITRNPFQRLLSAYKSKFTQGQKWYEENVGPRIIKENYLSSMSYNEIEEIKGELKKGGINSLTTYLNSNQILQIKRMEAGVGNINITFLEFLNYVTSPSLTDDSEIIDHHWAPFTVLCNPCAVKYDILVKFETLSQDSQAILDYVQARGSSGLINFPKRKPQVDSSTCRKEFEKVPIHIRKTLYQIYRADFLIFDYQFNKLENSFC